MRRRSLLLIVVVTMAFAIAGTASATANYVYHEQTENYINGGSSGYKYFQTSGSHGITPWSTDTVYTNFKVEYQTYTTQVRVYYTTDGTAPAGSFGTGSGTTTVQTCTYNGTFGSPVVDVVTCPGIPPQAKGTTVNYILSAWHGSGGDEIFANSGGCTTSTCATVFSYTLLGPNAVTLRTLAGSSRLSVPMAIIAFGMVSGIVAIFAGSMIRRARRSARP